MNVALAHFPDMDATRNPIVQLTDTNEAMADSRDVAAYFEKRHPDVLRNIRELHCSPEFRERNFAPFKINDLTGESTSHVTMTKDGFTFLAMGFTGAKAAIFKERYINQFNVMEAEIRRRSPGPAFQVPTSFSEALRLAASQADEIERQKNELAVLAPKGAFVDQFVNAEGLFGYHNAARALGCGPQRFCKWLKPKYCFSSAGALTPKTEWVIAGYFAIRSFIDDEGKTRHRGYVTPKGIEYFSRLVPPEIKTQQPAPAPSEPAMITH